MSADGAPHAADEASGRRLVAAALREAAEAARAAAAADALRAESEYGEGEREAVRQAAAHAEQLAAAIGRNVIAGLEMEFRRAGGEPLAGRAEESAAIAAVAALAEGAAERLEDAVRSAELLAAALREAAAAAAEEER